MINLYIAAAPIGNYDDITLRAIEVLKKADFIICESEREYRKLFGRLKIEIKKFIVCSEKTEKEAVELTLPLLEKGEVGVIISDCGTPIIEDPGSLLVTEVLEKGFKVSSVPGPSSIVTALSLTPFKINNYFFAGRISPRNYERKNELLALLKRSEPIILIETPYRLENMITLLKEINSKRKIFIAYNLTMEDEEIIWGQISDVEKKLKNKDIKKGEFIIIIDKK